MGHTLVELCYGRRLGNTPGGSTEEDRGIETEEETEAKEILRRNLK